LEPEPEREIHLDEEPKPWEISDEQLLADVEVCHNTCRTYFRFRFRKLSCWL